MCLELKFPAYFQLKDVWMYWKSEFCYSEVFESHVKINFFASLMQHFHATQKHLECKTSK